MGSAVSDDRDRTVSRDVVHEMGRALVSVTSPRALRARTVWWVQVLGAVFCLAMAGWVWYLAGGELAQWRRPEPWFPAAVAFVGASLLCLMTDAEARATTRAAAREQADADRLRVAIPDGYVLAYELTRAGEGPEPVVVVGAISAGRWDLSTPLWRFAVLRVDGEGWVAQLGRGGMFAVSAVPGFFAELDRGRFAAVEDVERALTARGARDVTACDFPGHQRY
jgi:hypothetical protein